MLSVRARMHRLFQESKADVILIANTKSADSNFLYMTGFTSGLFEGAYLIITPKKEILITNPLEYLIAKKERPREMQVVNATGRKQVLSIFKQYMKNKTVGINGNFLPYNAYKRLKELTGAKKFVDISDGFTKAREVKDHDEIAKITKAVRIIKKVLNDIEEYFSYGISEKDIADKVEELMKSYGADGPSFPTIVCFGANAAIPHHMPDNTRLKPNSFVLIDCGARYKNYCSDITRTFIFEPYMTSQKYKRMSEMISTVRRAQKKALESMRPGVRGKVPHNTAAETIDKAAGGRYKGKFIHSLGHSIGIEVHDSGTGFYPSEEGKLKENMIISDEPGIYIEGFGGVRIEDDVIITKRGAKML